METKVEGNHPDRIKQFFEDKTVLISGVTGFIGKVLLEKLLRAFPKVKRVVTLIRTKKGMSAEERMSEILSGPLFDKIREECPQQLEKVIAFRGDVSEIGLQLCGEDRDWLCEEVQLVYHCAATIRFDEPLRRAVLTNVRGTKEMLDLARNMKNLQVFQYVSTTFCHLEEKELFEKPYEPPANPQHMINICEWLKEEDVELLAPRLLHNCPNSYAFTKALTEALVLEERDNLPVLIMRLSIVVPIWKEPIPGWTDTLNGPAGILIGAGKGVIRTMYIRPDTCADYIPVDIVANGLLVATFLNTLNPNKKIYHLSSNQTISISHREIIDIGKNIVVNKVPFPGTVWYPGGSMKTSKFYNNVCIFFLHTIPAILVDSILYVLGYEPVLMRVQRRINKGFEVFEYYANNEWRFNNQDSLNQLDMMNSTEKKKYRFDSDGLDNTEYLTNCVLSIRKYMLNEPHETIPACRRNMKILWLVDRSFKIIFIYAFFYILYNQLFLRVFS